MEKILILTEFINDKTETLNSFENILQNEFYFYLKIKKSNSIIFKNLCYELYFYGFSYLAKQI